jgi:spermidine synthase
VVAYRAPRITYAPDTLPRDRLLALLHAVHITPGELLADSAAIDLPPRLAAYWAARDQFIAAGRQVRPTADVATMLAQVREPLLGVLHTSPDFRPAREPLLRMAQALAASDPPAAQALLRELDQPPP